MHSIRTLTLPSAPLLRLNIEPTDDERRTIAKSPPALLRAIHRDVRRYQRERQSKHATKTRSAYSPTLVNLMRVVITKKQYDRKP